MLKIKYFCYLWCCLLTVACVATPPTNHSKPPGDWQNHTTGGVRVWHISHQEASPEIMIYAMSLVGLPYQYGSSSRDAGFDCSGLVVDVYQNALRTQMPRTANDMANAGIPIPKNQLKIGDLVFFNTTGAKFSHVGIYLGENRFLHAPNSRSLVKIGNLDSSYWQQHYSGARTYFIK